MIRALGASLVLIFVFDPTPDTGLLPPLWVPRWYSAGSVFGVNEVTLILDGGWSAERPSHDQKLGLFSPTPHRLRRGEGLEMELVTDHASVRKPP